MSISKFKLGCKRKYKNCSTDSKTERFFFINKVIAGQPISHSNETHKGRFKLTNGS